MIQSVTAGLTTDVGVTLLDGSEVPVVGVAFGAVTVTYRKNGAASYSSKSLLSGQWNEVGDGLYRVTFTSSELDTKGSFRFLVKGGAFDRYESDLTVVDEFQTLAEEIVAIKAALGSKANTRDVDILFNQLELRMQQLEKMVRDINRRMGLAEGQLSALRAT